MFSIITARTYSNVVKNFMPPGHGESYIALSAEMSFVNLKQSIIFPIFRIRNAVNEFSIAPYPSLTIRTCKDPDFKVVYELALTRLVFTELPASVNMKFVEVAIEVNPDIEMDSFLIPLKVLFVVSDTLDYKGVSVRGTPKDITWSNPSSVYHAIIDKRLLSFLGMRFSVHGRFAYDKKTKIVNGLTLNGVRRV